MQDNQAALRPEVEPNGDARRGLLDDLEKYAGWLRKGVEATRVRDDVRALRAIVDGRCSEFETTADLLEINIRKVPESAIRGILSKALRRLRATA